MQQFKTLQPPPNLPLHPIPLVNCEEMVQCTSTESQNIQLYPIPVSGHQNSLTPIASSTAKTFATLSAPSVSSTLISGGTSTFSTATLPPLTFTQQLEPFSNSIGSSFANLPCVNPTEVHIEGYLSPTPNKIVDINRTISPSNNEIQPELPSTSRDSKTRIPQNIDCSNADFSSVNEELLSPANFSTYDHNQSSASLNTGVNMQRISSPKDVPVFSMPDSVMDSSSKKDHYDSASPSHIQDPEEGVVLRSPMKGVSTDQKVIDMGVEFHMMLQKQNYLKKPGLHHEDRLVPISAEATDEGGGDMEDDDDEIEDNFNWDKLL